MSDFSDVFHKVVGPPTAGWRGHCRLNNEDCSMFPSSQMKSDVRRIFDIDDDEEILFIRDTSFWNERNEGTVITDKCLYLIPDNDKPNEGLCFAWQDILKVTYNDAIVCFWVDDNINDAYKINISWFLKDVDSSSLCNYYGKNIANILNECVKVAVDPIKLIWDEFAEKYDNEKDSNKRIELAEEVASRMPEESELYAYAYFLMGCDYRRAEKPYKALQCYQTALSHSEYGGLLYGDTCYRMESVYDIDIESNGIDIISKKRMYALEAARFADNENKLSIPGTNCESTYREDALNDFREFDEEYAKHFLELPYKDRKTLLIVNTYDGLFQDHFVTLHIDSDLSALSFPIGHPKVNEIYIAHPQVTNRYMPIESYQSELIEDRVREFCELAQGLGATEINIECLNNSSNDTTDLGDRDISGSISRGRIGIQASAHNEYSRRLIEEISQSISLHQTFLPNKAPTLPSNLVWYDGEPSWQRLYRQRIEGGLLTHEERIETKKSQMVDNRELKEIKGELQSLFAKLDVDFDKTEEEKFEQQENAVLAISVTFAPLSQLLGETTNTAQAFSLSASAQKYISEVKECLEDGKITKIARRLLNMQREKLGISEDQAAELEASVCSLQLTDEEKEYLEAYKEACEDGQLSDKDSRMLNRLRSVLGITEERAKEIENQNVKI